MSILIPVIIMLLMIIVPVWQDEASKKKSSKTGHDFPPEHRKPFGAANERKAKSPAISKQGNDQAVERKPVQTPEHPVTAIEPTVIPRDKQGCESAGTGPAPQAKKSEPVRQTKEAPNPETKIAKEISFRGNVLSREDVNMLSGGTRIDMTSFTIPKGVMKIADHAFENCFALTDVVIPASVNSIGACAFKNCGNLSQITLPKNLRSIGDSAFRGCTYLTHVSIPDSVKRLGSGAFSYCVNLTGVMIPDSVTFIGGDAFTHCRNLTLTVGRSSYARQYCIEHSLKYTYPDAIDWLNQ